MHARIGTRKQVLAKSVVKGQEEELVTVSTDAEKLVGHTGGQAGATEPNLALFFGRGPAQDSGT